MIKVTVFLNGDHVSGGKVLSFPSSATIKDLLAEASKVLIPDGSSKLLRVFTERGQEIGSVDDISPGDLLYFSKGEAFVLAGDDDILADAPRMHASGSHASADSPQAQSMAQGPDSGANAGQQQQQQQQSGYLRSFATTAAGLVSAGYSASSAYIKANAPPSVSEKLVRLEHNVSTRGQPYISAAGYYTGEALNWADAKLGVASEQVAARMDKFMKSERGQKLREKLNPIVDAISPVAARVGPAAEKVAQQAKLTAEMFYAHAADSFHRVRAHGLKAALQRGGPGSGAGAADGAGAGAGAVEGQASASASGPASGPGSGAGSAGHDGDENKSGGSGNKPSREEQVAMYIGTMKESLGALWNDQLVPAANQMYDYFHHEQQQDQQQQQQQQQHDDAMHNRSVTVEDKPTPLC